MRKPQLRLLVLAAALTSLYLSLPLFQISFSEGEAETDRIDLAMEQEYQLTYDPALGRVPRERLFKALQIRNQSWASSSGLNTAVPGLTWTERGPNNIGGRTRALCFDLNDAPNYRKVWAGGVSGGLWYSNDITQANPSWVKVNDLLDNLAISCIAQSKVNPQVMYFGTGEGWFNIDAVQGLGIWKSSDGGGTWSQLPATNNSVFYYVQKIAVDNSGNVYACTRSGGLQKSVDGGATWTKVLGSGVNGGVTDRAADLEMAPNGDLYCSLGIGSIGTSSRIYRSVNQGSSWTDISPASIAAKRIELATCPSTSDTVYAVMQGISSNDVYSIQRYRVSTNTWIAGSVPYIIDQGSYSIFTRSQAWYDLIAAVDPNKPSSLYIGGVDALRSDDGGATWTQMTTWSLYGAPAFTASQNIHADHHAIVYAPGSSSRAIWGTDGGVYYTANANVPSSQKPTFVSKNTGYNVTQYYAGALHPTSTNYFIGGTQDNGSHKFLNAGMNSGIEISGGDGGFCHIDNNEPNIQLSSYVYNNYFVSTDGGVSFNGLFLNNRGRFINPTDYDPVNNILYGGDDANAFFRWTNPAAGGTDEAVTVPAFSFGAVTHVAVSPLTNNRVFFGLSNGAVVMVDNAHTGTNLNGVVVRAATNRSVSCIAIDPSNENHLVVTYTNYGADHVYETFNALQPGPTWASVNGNLPDMPVRWALFDPRNSDWMLLATELGVWSTDNLNGASTDWDPTNNGMANVRVDMLDYRSSDRTLLAATHGRGIFTTLVPDVTTPDVNFTAGYTLAAEESVASLGCRGYKEYGVGISIANAPTGDATVTLQVEAGNTAVRGVDFDFTTNGNFSSSSDVVVFSSGVKSTKTFTLRVYDDAIVEGTEFFRFAYTISGATNAQAGSGVQKHSISIYDNDYAPAGASTSTYTIGTPTYYLGDPTDGTGNSQPFDARLQSRRTLFVYQAAELTAAGLSAGSITAIEFNFGIKNSIRPYTNLKVKMGATSIAYPVNGGLTIPTVNTHGSYSSFSPQPGWNQLVLDNPFVWDGLSNIAVEVCYDNGTAASGDRADLVIGYPDGGSASQGAMIWQDNVGCNQNFSSVTYYTDGVKPQVRFTNVVQGTAIETALNSQRSVYLGPFAEVNFYSAGGKIIGSIKNLTDHDYGCTQMIIDRAGTGALPFWNSNVTNYLMSKTFQVLPANNNPTGRYQITLYFDKSEVDGWVQVTGNNYRSIALIKVATRISDVTPSNTGGGGVVEAVTPIRDSFGIHSTLSYTFSTGFSGFGAGIINYPLPVFLMDFNGRVQNQMVKLDWSTTAEFNTKEFVVERSADGVTFQPLGTVPAAGNSPAKTRYTFTDRDRPLELQYYRLRLLDVDGNSEWSKAISIRQPMDNGNWVRLLNNPVFHNRLELQFLRAAEGNLSLTVMDVSGKVMLRQTLRNNGSTRFTMDLSPYALPAGAYFLSVEGQQQRYQQTFLKY